MKYLIQYGVGGGYNDTENYEIHECESQSQADSIAYERAIETFDSYDVEGFDIPDIEEDEEGYLEGREDWLDYSAVPYDEEKHKDLQIEDNEHE